MNIKMFLCQCGIRALGKTALFNTNTLSSLSINYYMKQKLCAPFGTVLYGEGVQKAFFKM